MQGVNYQDVKPKTFTSFIFPALKTYLAKHPEKKATLNEDLQGVAFHVTNKDPNSTIFKQAAQIFQFPKSTHLFEPHIRNLCSLHEYVKAARTALHCGVVHEDFVYGFLMPITFSRDQVCVAYDYLDMATALQAKLLYALDSMMTANASENLEAMLITYEYRNIPKE